jgi:hypothetical protein
MKNLRLFSISIFCLFAVVLLVFCEKTEVELSQDIIISSSEDFDIKTKKDFQEYILISVDTTGNGSPDIEAELQGMLLDQIIIYREFYPGQDLVLSQALLIQRRGKWSTQAGQNSFLSPK